MKYADSVEIEELICRSLMGKLLPEQQQKLDEWLADPAHEQQYKRLSDPKRFEDQRLFLSRHDPNKVWAALQRKIYLGRRRKIMWRSIAAVAVPVMVALVVLNSHKETYRDIDQQVASAEIPGNVATVKLANGEVINLENSSSYDTTVTGNIVMTNHRGLLVCESNPASSNGKVTYNEITTPATSEYQVILPDGTKVWLNGESSLRFPTSFSNNKREVFAKGDVYFDVTHDAKKPFHVVVDQFDVEVFGTVFNICNYKGAPCSATLISGSVQLTSKAGAKVKLKPNQQAVVDGGISVKRVDTSAYTAWVEGYFLFDDKPLSEILTTLSRWYNMEVEYESAHISNERFSIEIKRQTKLADVVDMLEEAGPVSFDIQGRKITVK